ncbi:AXL2 (YIL140W) [Zygosaccharomyces parabailii]|uniref:ZYBA0S04-08064g1_1 n=1 Tax=Zygosaccharomyces bailii (strain CLIB 213 / ATCC 58445 / CBS 680 / BCRC 21525 / NBRC 1098 / NCYC 1416 / NRRL Y-2227) TaxID=1333698 RepID=A0A8J2X833_ZYGB2|nr:AXL2 (YIL140W) [Zygosaccharomyces parabailii]CDF89596.1 ZYBA0S04-08064g1_1 [Zygosaccharomyces bailii CLIB 213]CDH13714.1 related to Axial budding pattern protein 2 [Zygosaccharomyces bailii ISA1307]
MLDIPILVVLAVVGPLVGVRCQPFEAFPLSAQWPPVARVGKEFTFQISNDTFQSTNTGVQVEYQAFDLPNWLSFDSAARTFSGTASKEDLNDGVTTNVPITLQGTDPSDNQALNKTYSFAVTDKKSVEVASNFNLLALLKNYGSTNGQGGLILKPNQVFNVTFDRDSFTNQDYITEYYGLSEPYNAPLPSWMKFDANNLEFSGVAPVAHSEIAPQMTYKFALGATDVNGYTSASIPFSIVVGAHELTTSIQNTLLVNVSKTGHFEYDLPLDYVFLDNETISNDDLGEIEPMSAPTWVTLENNTLTGDMPMDHTNSNVTFSVAVHDIYDDAIYWNFVVESTHKLFATTTLPNLNATRGEWFEYHFLPSQFTNINDTQVSMNFTNSSQNHAWISFKSSNLTMLGKVPDDFKSLSMALVATEGSESQQLEFELIGMNSTKHHNHTSSHSSSSRTHSSSKSHTSSTSSTKSYSHTHARTRSSGSRTATATTSTASSGSAIAPTQKSHSSTNTAAIAAGVAVPLGVIAVAAIIFFLWWRRRNNKQGKDAEESPDISSPDLDNPANRPDQVLASNPFDDENSIGNAERLGALANLHLDGNSYSGSDISTLEDEKGNSYDGERTIHRELTSPSNEMLLPNPPPVSHQHDSDLFNSNDRSSSVYFESEPATRKSWRYTDHSRTERSLRGSVKSNTTVSTADLFNTVIKEDEPLPKDPRKSTLGLRDSVFWDRSSPTKSSHTRSRGKFNSESDILPILDEQSHNSNYRPNMTMSSSSSDELVPMQENGKFNWVHRPKDNKNQNQKRLVQTQNESNVDVGQVDEVEGRVPEQI